MNGQERIDSLKLTAGVGEVDYAGRKFSANMKRISEKNKVSLRTVFRWLDVNNDGVVSYTDFCRGKNDCCQFICPPV